MARTIHNLPNEILAKTLHCLDHKSLKKARLVSHRWAKAGAAGLFRRVYFAPHHDIMEVFMSITSEPAFASSVQELVYDGRLFWQYLTDPDAHGDMYRHAVRPTNEKEYDEETDTYVQLAELFGKVVRLEEGPDAYEERATKSCERYEELFEEQEEILDEGLDFDFLCDGLQKLPNLNTVTIIQAYPGQKDIVRFQEKLSPWYERPSLTVWQETLAPTSWSVLAGEATEAPDFSISWDIIEENPWDWRGVVNVLKAIALHCPKVINFHYGTHAAPMPMHILSQKPVFSSMRDIAKNLTCIKLMTSTLVDDDPDERLEPGSEAYSAFKAILDQAQQLRTLSSNMVSRPRASRSNFSTATWPRLSVLQLGFMHVDLQTLKGLCHRHEDTLRDLKLIFVALDDMYKGDTWSIAGKELGSFLRLRSLTLRGLSTYLFADNSSTEEEVGYDIMRWVPRRLLEVKVLEDIWVEMCHE